MISSKSMSRHYAVHPRKRLGQSFLQDRNIVTKIVALAGLQADEGVVEIGAGLGVMTGLIAAAARRVMAVEIDPRLVTVLRETLASAENVQIVHTDVLTFDLRQAAQELSEGKIKVIGNIPYHISTPILFHLLAFRQVISSAVLMVQKEVAERICAGPGTKSYGIPSVLVAVYARASLVFSVPASCFYPAPKVTSAVMKIDFRQEPIAPISHEGFFSEIVRLAFGSRRKTLMNNLKRYPPFAGAEQTLQRIIIKEGLDLQIRGEALTPKQFISLSNALFTELMLS